MRVILFKSSAATPRFFKSKHQHAVQIALKKVATRSNGAKFCNSYSGSFLVDALNAATFKVDDKAYATTQEV